MRIIFPGSLSYPVTFRECIPFFSAIDTCRVSSKRKLEVPHGSRGFCLPVFDWLRWSGYSVDCISRRYGTVIETDTSRNSRDIIVKHFRNSNLVICDIIFVGKCYVTSVLYTHSFFNISLQKIIDFCEFKRLCFWSVCSPPSSNLESVTLVFCR